MQTRNNSNTTKWCPDCKNKTSSRQCSYNHGAYSLPCHILRKVANKTFIAYDTAFQAKRDSLDDVMPCDFEEIIYKITGANYYNNQDIPKDIILAAMLHRAFSACQPDEPDMLKYLFEYSEFCPNQINQIVVLSGEIQTFQTKLKNEWFAIPGNKEYYLHKIKK